MVNWPRAQPLPTFPNRHVARYLLYCICNSKPYPKIFLLPGDFFLVLMLNQRAAMSKKQILIVDDEKPILTVLENSLKKLDYHVATATDGFVALDYLLEQPFDLVITDYNMGEIDGLELLEAIHYAQPSAQVIMITAYGSDALKAETRRLQAYRYLTKPLEINTFRQVVQEALGDIEPAQPAMPVLSDDHYQQVNQMLEQLLTDVGARCVFLSDIQGQAIARAGHTDKLPAVEMGSLLGAGMATLSEAGRVLDADAEAINLAYRESDNGYLYAVNIGPQQLLILVIDRSSYSSRLGTVWYHARQTALALRQIVSKVAQVTPQQIFNPTVDRAFEAELDKLFD